MTERALDGWVHKFVVMWALRGARTVDQFTGRLDTVGSDGIIFQPASSPRQTWETPPQELPPLQFFPWHSIRSIELVDEQAAGNEG
jgi:hypothetical protein